MNETFGVEVMKHLQTKTRVLIETYTTDKYKENQAVSTTLNMQ